MVHRLKKKHFIKNYTSLDSQCAGDFSIPESRMSDTVHNLAIEVGSVKTMHECSKSVKQLHSTAYMATMQNPLRAPFNASASYTCFAILLKLDGEANRMVFDHNFMSCFIKGNSVGKFCYISFRFLLCPKFASSSKIEVSE